MREENATARINKRGRFKVVDERWGLLESPKGRGEAGTELECYSHASHQGHCSSDKRRKSVINITQHQTTGKGP
jgi:hypothetical protein